MFDALTGPALPSAIMATMPEPPPALLLTEILQFSPAFFMDQIYNIFNESVTDTIDGMEEFLVNWADKRVAARPEELKSWDRHQEIETGLITFQTLLENRTDLAFDFFEIWTKRNIFYIDPKLPIVVPHQAGLDLSIEAEKELELIAELDDLRRKIHNVSGKTTRSTISSNMCIQQRRLKRLQLKAIRDSSFELRRARARNDRLSIFSSNNREALLSLPKSIKQMYAAVSTVPPVDLSTTLSNIQEMGSQPWQSGRKGYLDWAVKTLLNRVAESKSGDISSVQRLTESIANVDTLKVAIEEMKEGSMEQS